VSYSTHTHTFLVLVSSVFRFPFFNTFLQPALQLCRLPLRALSFMSSFPRISRVSFLVSSFISTLYYSGHELPDTFLFLILSMPSSSFEVVFLAQAPLRGLTNLPDHFPLHGFRNFSYLPPTTMTPPVQPLFSFRVCAVGFHHPPGVFRVGPDPTPLSFLFFFRRIYRSSSIFWGKCANGLGDLIRLVPLMSPLHYQRLFPPTFLPHAGMSSQSPPFPFVPRIDHFFQK